MRDHSDSFKVQGTFKKTKRVSVLSVVTDFPDDSVHSAND